MEYASVCRCLLLVVGSSAITHGEEGGQEGGGDRNDDECSRVIHVVNARAAGQAASYVLPVERQAGYPRDTYHIIIIIIIITATTTTIIIIMS